MMYQQKKVNEEVVVRKLAIYTFLQKFYAGQLNHVSITSWKELMDHLNKEWVIVANDDSIKGLHELIDMTVEDIEDLEYEFNRLFVGPNRLEVSPYESSYRNDQRSLMQSETLAVRRFYEKAGLVVSQKNIEPDDHLALELEFICYLLENSLEAEMYYKLYQDFLKEHLFHWIEYHCELIREKTKNAILIRISHVLQGLIIKEKSNVYKDGGKKS